MSSNSTSTAEEPSSSPSPSETSSPSDTPTSEPSSAPTTTDTSPTDTPTTTVTSTSIPTIPSTTSPTTSLDPTTTSTTITSEDDTSTSTSTTAPSSTTDTSSPSTESEPSSTRTTAPTTRTTSAPSTTSSSLVTTEFTTSQSGSLIIVTSVSTVTPTAAPDAPTSTAPGEGVMASGQPVGGGGGLNQASTIAVAVIVPIAGVALLVAAAIFFWRKRKQRKDAEEERRKEVEDYNYNPNADPTIPDVGGAGGAYEMKEDGSSGYRGWGSTTLGSTGRKASTTMSGGAAGVAYSDSRGGAPSDTRSGEALMEGTTSPEGEILGAMGPSVAETRGNVHRGPSNASSSYSAAGRSDGSGENGMGVAYYDQYNNGPYNQQGAGELGGQPIIRDNPARRNTRIENPSHFPQQSAGISQNF